MKPQVTTKSIFDRSGRRHWQAAVLAAMLLAMLALRQIATAGEEPDGAATVAVARVTREDLARQLNFLAEFRPYLETDLHAKVAGFLEAIYVDVGDKVVAGQKIATLEVPELRDDLVHAGIVSQRAEQEVNKAQAAYEDAHTTGTRLATIGKTQPNLIAQQDLDTAHAREAGAEAALSAAKLAVKEAQSSMDKLKTMLKYSEITAPFAGVITKRFADPGALIQAGTSSSTQALPLVRLSEMDKLRLSFPVSMSYVDKVQVGDEIEIRSTSTGKIIHARLSRLVGKVESSTRTMDVEADIPNPDYKIIPGTYASVILRLDLRPQALAVPSEAVSRAEQATVFVVNSRNELEERTIKLGLETPGKIEVLAGLEEKEFVVVGARQGFKTGQRVTPKIVEKVAVP